MALFRASISSFVSATSFSCRASVFSDLARLRRKLCLICSTGFCCGFSFAMLFLL